MKNQLVAKILYEIADLLEIKEVEFKPRAYKRAAMAVEALGDDIEDYAKYKNLDDIPGVGESIAKKIKEIIDTGKCLEHEKLKKEIPIDFEALLSVEGLGPKTVKLLYKKLLIRNLSDLEKAASAGKIAELEGFGEKSQQDILDGITLAKSKGERMLLDEATAFADDITGKLKELSHITQIEAVGSLRRMKETVGDIDIIAVTRNAKAVAEAARQLDNVQKVYSAGPTKIMLKLRDGPDVDIRIFGEKSYGAALLYFTGSKQHNISLREIAIRKKWKLNEYGIFSGKKQIAGKSEQEVYRKLGLDYMAPELREDRGEIEAARTGNLPRLVEQDEIKGDLHVHTTASDGVSSLQEMVDAAKQLGYAYIGISDHYGSLAIANSMDSKRLAIQHEAIDKINRQSTGIHIFKGAEVNINKNGTLDIEPEVLKKLDYAIISIHSSFRLSQAEQTKRVIRALNHDKARILGHLSARLLFKREPVELDYEAVFKAAKAGNVALEINSFPNRLDLNDSHAKAAKGHGCSFAIDTDSHNAEHLRLMRFGVGTARRGWIETSSVINTWPLKKVADFLG